MDSVHDECAGVEPITGLCRFRDGFYSCLGARADAQFELTEALLCADGPVRALVVSAQDGDLVPQHEDLDVLGGIGPGEQRQPTCYAGEHQVRESEGHDGRSCCAGGWTATVRSVGLGRKGAGRGLCHGSRH